MKKLLAMLLFVSCAIFPACANGSEAATITTPTDAVDSATDSTAESLTESATDFESATVTEIDSEGDESKMEEGKLYYVRTPEQPPEQTQISYPVHIFDSYYLAAKKAEDPRLAAMGYALYSEDGKFIHGLYNEYVTNMLFRAKYISDFTRKYQYEYGDVQKNPGLNFQAFLKRGTLRERLTCCDRFVGWVLYEMGYTDQPAERGMFVWANASSSEHNLMIFLEKHDYERIDSTTDFRAGDIVFVNPTTSSGGSPFGSHVFICAGSTGKPGEFYRYDHGSNTRIQSVQPSKESIRNLFCVYRPTQTTAEDMPTAP